MFVSNMAVLFVCKCGPCREHVHNFRCAVQEQSIPKELNYLGNVTYHHRGCLEPTLHILFYLLIFPLNVFLSLSKGKLSLGLMNHSNDRFEMILPLENATAVFSPQGGGQL